MFLVRGVLVVFVLVLTWAGVIAAKTGSDELPPAQVKAARDRWGAEIEKMKAKAATETHPADAILFLGSSSIRLWEGIAKDMAPYHPIQRGYGGAKFADLAVFAEELVAPHSYRAAVVFVGNDVTGKDSDATVEQVVEWFQRVAEAVRNRQPGAQVFCVEITPTPSRWKAWAKIQAVNAALKTACLTTKDSHFIATASAYLNSDGRPRPELFKEDQLHQNESGYALWSKLIKARLDETLGR